ncbi:MAG: phosphomannomutase/phosphoglucomutase [Proteobacteria bacterium]|nr:phosphomannomutase/phosphoglucomutase [Cystobacterineae bacterium]MCL2259645.1 phosphomannomutase/phosphoglucomutase [Cystobacterineae bacterium]MCL2313826.1 phosphomannomutase/phosphoglucomutase [Pseudomonadota bacterium]
MQAHIFREYDIRGIAAADLDEVTVAGIGKALATRILRTGGRAMVVGRDCRNSAERLFQTFSKAILETGVDIWDIGVVPTPVTYYAAHALPADGLAMITGSHNPPEYNGFKVGIGHTTLYGESIQSLRKQIEAGDFEKRGGGRMWRYDILTPYLHNILQIARIEKKPLKVVVDAGNGVGALTSIPLLKRLGFEVKELFCEMDGNFPNHEADPTVAKNLEVLIETVKREKADMGVAYDGDADRIGVVDELGNILWGDKLMILFGRQVLEAVPGATIIGEVKCSMTLYDDIAKHGGEGIMWKTGHSLIKSKMKDSGALLAGEMSGHIFFKDRYFGFDDAAYATVRLLEILTKAGKPLSQLLAGIPETHASPELRVPAEEAQKFHLVARCAQLLKKAGHDCIETDGVRVRFEDGWGLVRASNTQPLLVIRWEATTQSRMAEIQQLIEGTIASAKAELGLK